MLMMQRKRDDQFEIIILQQSADQWREDLSGFDCSLFMTPEWVEAVTSDNKLPVFLSFVKNGHVVGKLAGLCVKQGKLRGDQFFFYTIPCLKKPNQNLLNDCCSGLLDFARGKGVQRVIMGSYDQPTGLICTVPGFYPNERYEYVVDLQPESGDVSFSQNLKRNVKKAKKLNAVLVNGDTSQMIQRLVELLSNTLEKRATKYGKEYNPFYLPYMNETSLQRLLDLKVGKIYMVKLEGDEVPHSVLFNLEAGGRVFNLLVGSDDLAYQYGLAALADFELIHKYKEIGFRSYNLGGGTGDAGSAGLERSKQSKGAEKMMVYGATTNFLCYPHRLINPLLNLGRSLPRKHPVVDLFQRIIR
jgi:hypothetical protein